MNSNYWIAYGMMFVVIVVVFITTKRQHQKYRAVCDPFGIAFTEAATHVLGAQPPCKLVCETAPNGNKWALAPEQQSAAMQEILIAGADDYMRERLEIMENVLTQISTLTATNKHHQKLYLGVLSEIYRVALLFSEGCQDLTTLKCDADFEEFGLYMENQPFIRSNIAKRMTPEGIEKMKAISRQPKA